MGVVKEVVPTVKWEWYVGSRVDAAQLISGKARMKKLNLYTMDMKYVRDLAKVDDNVLSVSPQENKQRRPFVGVVAES